MAFRVLLRVDCTRNEINECFTGWFYRVINEGEVHVGDKMKLIERKNSNFSIEKIAIAAYGNKREIKQFFADEEEYLAFVSQMTELPELAYDPYKKIAAEVLIRFKEGTSTW